MSFRRGRRSYTRTRTVSWEQMTAYASHQGVSFPVSKLPVAQDIIAFAAGVRALVETFFAVRLDTTDSRTGKACDIIRETFMPMTVAAGRINHNPQSVQAGASHLLGLALAIAYVSGSAQMSLDMWDAIGRCLFGSLTTIEQRHVQSCAAILDAMVKQAQLVQVPSSGGYLTLPGSMPAQTPNPFGGVLPNQGPPTQPVPTGMTTGQQAGSALAGLVGTVEGNPQSGAALGGAVQSFLSGLNT